MRQTEPEGSPPVERCLACEADGEQGGLSSPPRTADAAFTRSSGRRHLLTIGLASEAALHGWLPLRRVAVSPIRRFASLLSAVCLSLRFFAL